MATLTASGINCSDGTLDGQYTGTSKTASLPIGSVVYAFNTTGTAPVISGVNSTIPYVKYDTRSIPQGCVYYLSNTASVASYTNLSGTWRNRGGAVDGCNGSLLVALAQRVA